MRTVGLASFVLVGSVWVGGQASLPANYKVQFENAWVRVTSIRYAPLEKLAPHSHTPYPSAYVYLNDGPPVIFRHIGGNGMAATRAATKAGAFRVYRGVEEIHEVENTGDAPSEFLRVEFKTAAAEPGSFFGKFERPVTPSAEPIVQFNHPQVRISRLWVAPGRSIDVAANSERPVLIIALAKGVGLNGGESRWIEAATHAPFDNRSSVPIDLLRVDFKTQPVETHQ